MNKLDIATQFRELNLELLAGEPNFTATVKEHGILFEVPFDKVYWNSRLSHEHQRLIDQLAPSDQLFDVMAGIGPFALPALRKGLSVTANDLNPASAATLKANAQRNFPPATNGRLVVCCEDGRAFIRRVRREVLCTAAPPGRTRHFVMNLPAIAVTFLDAFVDPPLSDDDVDRDFIVHCYCFSRAEGAENAAADAIRQCEGNLRLSLDPGRDVVCVHVVRDVAPHKLMICVSFKIPPAAWLHSKKHRAE